MSEEALNMTLEESYYYDIYTIFGQNKSLCCMLIPKLSGMASHTVLLEGQEDPADKKE